MGTAGKKPQASAGKASRRRILRVGVVLSRSLIEERQILERNSVSIGQSFKNTFSIPIEALPREFTMFAMENGQYRLQFTNAMDGRISDGGNPLRLADLKAKSEQKGDLWSYPLGEHSRGKIEVGECTILFQFVAEPPVQPKPMLPASVRGTFADRLDPTFTAILTTSLVLMFGGVMYVKYGIDPPAQYDLVGSAQLATFAPPETTIEEPVKVDLVTQPVGTDKVEAKPDQAGGPKTPEPPKPNSGGGGDTGPKTPEPPGGGRASDDAVALQDEAAKFADMLVGENDDPFGGTAAGDSRRSPGSDLGKVLGEVASSGGKVAVGQGSGTGTKGSGGVKLGTGTGPNLGGGGTGITGEAGGKVDQGPAGRISVADKSGGDDSTLTPDAVLRKIMAAFMPGLKRCYKDYLKTDGSARGKVSLSFTVNETGRSVSNRAKGVAPEVEQCIKARMDSWRFDIPKDGDGEPTEAGFEISLQLVPE